MKQYLLSVLLALLCVHVFAQDTSKINPRPITLAEYEKAKTYKIKNLDNDTYAKFDNTYILDRYELRKPYYITGDDGMKKRMDLYKLVAKEGMQELGTMIFYTNEKGNLYTALQPNFTADATVWNRYFEDIHAIDKVEKNFVLKLSYVLSKELSFQLYKAINKGKDMKEESGTYGSDICFPGDDEVEMADGSTKLLSEIKAGDKVITVDPTTKKPSTVIVKKLIQHAAKNYAITKLLIVASDEIVTTTTVNVTLHSKVLEATPNHPMITTSTKKKMSKVAIGDEIICLDKKTNIFKTYTVFNKEEVAGGMQKVYNMEVSAGSTFIMNGVMVMQK